MGAESTRLSCRGNWSRRVALAGPGPGLWEPGDLVPGAAPAWLSFLDPN